jgi:hypothetical protein
MILEYIWALVEDGQHTQFLVKILFLLDEAPSITCESRQFHSPFYPIKPQVFITPLKVLGTTDEALLGRNVDKLSKVLDLYEEWLCNKKYSVGNSFNQ